MFILCFLQASVIVILAIAFLDDYLNAKRKTAEQL